MTDRGQLARPPVVLIVDNQEWSTRSLESVLAPNGYAVLRAYTSASGFEQARAHPPDLIFISTTLPDGDGIDLCQSIRSPAALGASVPIFMTSPDRPSREDKLKALRTGAWDFISYPIDAQELLLKLDGYVRAKFETDHARERCLVDEPTGLYNLRGLEQRARELRSQAYRDRQALACVVVAPAVALLAEDETINVDERTVQEAVERLGKALKDIGRVSDAIGKLGQAEFAILAPSTDAGGAVKLAERLATAIKEDTSDDDISSGAIEIRAGFDAVDDIREAPIGAMELLLNATTALRTAKDAGTGESWIHQFNAD